MLGRYFNPTKEKLQSRWYGWIAQVLLYSMVIQVSNTTVLHWHCAELKNSDSVQIPHNTVDKMDILPETQTYSHYQTEFIEARQETIELVQQKIREVENESDLIKIPGDETSSCTVREFVAAMMQCHKLWKETITGFQDIIWSQSFFLMELGSMKDYNEDIIHEMSLHYHFEENLSNDDVVNSAPEISRCINNMKIHHFLNLRAANHPFSLPKSTHAMDAATLISSLREGIHAPKDIVRQAAVEEMFLSFLRYGKCSEDQLQLMRYMISPDRNDVKGHTEHIEYLAKAFLIQQVNPHGFIAQKIQWIQEIGKYTIDIEIKYKIFVISRRSLAEKNEKQDATIPRKLSEPQNPKIIYEKIETLNSIMMKLHMHESLSVHDCKFVFQNVDKHFWWDDLRLEGIIRNHKYKEMGKHLFKKWGHTILSTYTPEYIEEVHDVKLMEDILRGRYLSNKYLVRGDMITYQTSLKELIREIKSIQYGFEEQSHKILNDLSMVNNWYSRKSHISFSVDNLQEENQFFLHWVSNIFPKYPPLETSI